MPDDRIPPQVFVLGTFIFVGSLRPIAEYLGSGLEADGEGLVAQGSGSGAAIEDRLY